MAIIPSEEIRSQIMALVESGAPRPVENARLHRYINEVGNMNSGSYDFNFSRKLKKLRPDWFEKKKPTFTPGRLEILEIAKSGAEKPSTSTAIGKRLSGYLNSSKLDYDGNFDRLIRELRPDWFIMRKTG